MWSKQCNTEPTLQVLTGLCNQLLHCFPMSLIQAFLSSFKGRKAAVRTDGITVCLKGKGGLGLPDTRLDGLSLKMTKIVTCSNWHKTELSEMKLIAESEGGLCQKGKTTNPFFVTAWTKIQSMNYLHMLHCVKVQQFILEKHRFVWNDVATYNRDLYEDGYLVVNNIFGTSSKSKTV